MRKPYLQLLLNYLLAFNDIAFAIVFALIITLNGIMEGESNNDGSISKSIIEKTVNIGWVIIALVLLVFVLNIACTIMQLWGDIQEILKERKEKNENKRSSKDDVEKQDEDIFD